MQPAQCGELFHHDSVKAPAGIDVLGVGQVVGHPGEPVDQGGGEPVFEATVTSNSGKRTEKATITKQGAQYFAKREGEPSIYEIDGKAVEDLQKAASDVKEQQAPAPQKK